MVNAMVGFAGHRGGSARSWAGLGPAAALGVMQTGSAVSIATLVFTGSASSHIGRAVSGFIIGSALVCAVLAWFTSFEVVVAGARNNVTVVVAAVAVGVADNSGTAAPLSVAAFVLVSVFSCGALMFLMGRFRLGYLVRFVPYPVMGGYVAGTAWLMIRGGLSVTVNETVGLANVGELLGFDHLKLWVPGLVLGVVIAFLSGANRQSLVIIGSVVAFHAAVQIAGNLSEVEADGWLIGPFPEGGGVSFLKPSEFAQVDWAAIVSALPGLPVVALISIIGLLLNITGVEFVTGERVDLDRELRVSGVATATSALVGGTIGFVGIGQTLLAKRLGASSKLVAGVFGAIVAVTLIGGPAIIALMPRWVAGALVMGPGIALMRRWIVDSVLHGSVSDRLLTVLIPLTVAFSGVLAGVGLGVVISAALFVWRYSTLDPVKHRTTGKAMRSSLDRSVHETTTLDTHGGEIVAMRLEGYLFFGSVARVGQRVRELLDEKDCPRHVVLDFHHVSGMDSSALVELHSLAELCSRRDVRLQCASAPEVLKDSFERVDGETLFAPDLDHALELAEADLLARAPDRVPGADGGGGYLSDDLWRIEPELLDRFTKIDVVAGTALMSIGDDSSGLFLVESGTLTVWTPIDGSSRRLRRVGPGAFLGEVGFFASEAATATVVADEAAAVWLLSRESFEQLRKSDPNLALKLTQHVLAVTAHRLKVTNALVGDLMR